MANLEDLLDSLNDIERLRNLIPDASGDDLNNTLWWAALNGSTRAIELLIPVSNPKRPGTMALIWAAERGHLDIVHQLTEVCNPTEKDSMALRCAARNGHLEVVRALVTASDVAACNHDALRAAVKHGHYDVFKVLVGTTNVEDLFRQEIIRARETQDEESFELIDNLVSYVGNGSISDALEMLFPYWLYHMPALLDVYLARRLAQALSVALPPK